ncbi:MAG: hypothetical protein M0Z45_10745 [Actinomycetota bacterium]|nr:hypothetical protein [Actinomycetota bacterium]
MEQPRARPGNKESSRFDAVDDTERFEYNRHSTLFSALDLKGLVFKETFAVLGEVVEDVSTEFYFKLCLSEYLSHLKRLHIHERTLTSAKYCCCLSHDIGSIQEPGDTPIQERLVKLQDCGVDL